MRRSPVPVQPAHSGRPSYGPDGNPGPPGWCLRSTSPGAASTVGLPLRPALALPHFRTPHEAPLIGQDASRISEVFGAGITIPGNPCRFNVDERKNSAVIRRVAAGGAGRGTGASCYPSRLASLAPLDDDAFLPIPDALRSIQATLVYRNGVNRPSKILFGKDGAKRNPGRRYK